MSDNRGGKVVKEKKSKDEGVKGAPGKAEGSPKDMPRMKKRYLDEIKSKLQAEFKYDNVMQGAEA